MRFPALQAIRKVFGKRSFFVERGRLFLQIFLPLSEDRPVDEVNFLQMRFHLNVFVLYQILHLPFICP